MVGFLGVGWFTSLHCGSASRNQPPDCDQTPERWRQMGIASAGYRLSLNHRDATLRTIGQIDLLWLRGRWVVRTFEVEHTTSGGPRIFGADCWPSTRIPHKFREFEMFAGHIGAALALGRADRGANVGVFVLSALLPDVVLWVLILGGIESASIPAGFALTHQPEFIFPYSHGLVASLCWSVLAGVVAFAWYPASGRARARLAVLVAAAVFSHWLLDVLVHGPEMPLLGVTSTKLGLGLWRNMPAALAVEAVMVVIGLSLFLAGAAMASARRLLLVALALLLLAFTVAGMTVAPPPPSVMAMAASSLLTILVVCGLFAWLGKPRR